MAMCRPRSVFLVLCALELVLTAERQIFDFLGYMWTPILANFLNVLFLIFGCFGAVQGVSKYLLAYVSWSIVWLAWNLFLICFFLNVGVLDRKGDLLSLGTGSISWWESGGWGCRPVWGEGDAGGTWVLRPERVDGCLLPWPRVELAQAVLSAVVTATAFAPAVLLAARATRHSSKANEKENTTRRPIYTVELSRTEAGVCESSIKPMTPRRVKRRSGSRGTNSSIRRSRRSYRNAGYLASSASLPRDPRPPRPASAHSSYSNFHGTRPVSYHTPETITSPVETTSFDIAPRSSSSGYDVAGPFDTTKRSHEPYNASGHSYEVSPSYESTARLDTAGVEVSYTVGPYTGAMYPPGDQGAWEAPPPPAPPYCARATPQAPGPPAYRASPDNYM